MKRSNITIVIYLCLVFLSGVLVGVIGMGTYASRKADAKNDIPTLSERRLRYRELLRVRLHLRPDQVAKVDSVLSQTHDRYDALRQKYAPEVQAIQDNQVQKMSEILDTQQRDEYLKIRQERELREKKNRQAEQPKRSNSPGC